LPSIRVRGVSIPERDEAQKVIVGSLRLFNASVNVDKLAPSVPFEIPLNHVSDLLLFDARANALQRIKVAGQVVHERHGEYFLMDGPNGLRFTPKVPVKLQEGDLVEVVGFPDMNGPLPALREALIHQTGKTNLPAARRLSENEMLNGKLDASLVCIEARMVGSSADRSDSVLELQTGNRGFVARLEKKNNGVLPSVEPGSQVELTGVYAGEGEHRTLGQAVDSFELLLNSPSNIRVLARPSWWTARHALTVIGAMVFIILAAAVWITLLHQQVEERSTRLAAEIQTREHTEHQRMLEAERSRIAQDLHDDLGATLTQIRFLSAVESCDTLVRESTRRQFKQVSEKARQMVASLDEIVWAVNPANDSLRSLVSYLRHVAEEFFRTTAVNCLLDVDKSLPAVTLTSEVRHNLYLSVREAFNNSAKHSNATELWLRIHWKEQTLQIIVEDNGCGFADQQAMAEQNGLTNMRRRLEKIGGRFECQTRPGAGTTCRMSLPIP